MGNWKLESITAITKNQSTSKQAKDSMQWITGWRSNPIGWDSDIGSWSAFCPAIVWHIWLACCDKVFKGIQPNPQHVFGRAKQFWLENEQDQRSTRHSPQLASSRTHTNIWKNPDIGTAKINLATNWNISTNIMTFAMVLRNTLGYYREVRTMEIKALNKDVGEVLTAIEAWNGGLQLQVTTINIEAHNNNLIRLMSGLQNSMDWQAKTVWEDKTSNFLNALSSSKLFIYV
ncbi:uncharacterized protein LOC113354266 [Papaver somniferum]|uniref:uncharacterized protein LOC113354266 n=1 Tax=Papaver somniferum TaxID=3469 RepID=UPI000E6F9778|nr:uncharacterized protein LOC113354266 [Papaver somniferum]